MLQRLYVRAYELSANESALEREEESIVIVKEINIEMLTDLHVFAIPEYAEVVFGMPSARGMWPSLTLQQLCFYANIWRLTVYPS
jgi:hypothetical protein